MLDSNFQPLSFYVAMFLVLLIIFISEYNSSSYSTLIKEIARFWLLITYYYLEFFQGHERKFKG